MGDHRVRERGRRRRDQFHFLRRTESSRRRSNSLGRAISRLVSTSDESGCSQWDSDYGQNFHFAIAQITTDPIVHFKSDFTTSTEGGVHAGEAITIDYDFRRLTQCRSYEGGNMPAWGITMFSQIDGGTVTTTELDRTVDGDRFGQPVVVTPPQGSHTLSLWFQNTDVYGCNAWDSDFGQNYVFDL